MIVDSVETEWQFESAEPPQRWLRRAVLPEGFTLGAPQSRSIADLYYDTDDWRLFRAGYALRLRHVGHAREVTLKQVSPASGGRHQRRELTAPVAVTSRGVDDGPAPRAMIDRLEGPLAERITAVAGTHPVRQVLELRTRRRVFPVERDTRPVGELALDVTSIPTADGAIERLFRVEIEVAAGADESELTPLVATLRSAVSLAPTNRSKFEEALRVRGLVPAVAAELGPTTVDDAMTTGAVALATLRRSFAALLEHEPGTRVGDDPEALHQMRVAMRRLRATLALFAEALPARALACRATLEWLADVLGGVRDLDVQLERLATWRAEMEAPDADALEALAALLRRRRVAARRRVLNALDCPRYERFVARFAVLLRGAGAPRGEAGRPILATAPALIEKRMRKARKAGDDLVESSPPPGYHALRIQCKKLRYALEAHADVYGKPLGRVASAVTRLQKLLGRHQDAEVAVEHLRALCAGRGAQRLSSHAIFVIGKIAERYEREARRLRRRFPKRYRAATRGLWKRLRRVMAKRGGSTPSDASARRIAAPGAAVAVAAVSPAAAIPATTGAIPAARARPGTRRPPSTRRTSRRATP